MQQVFRAVLFIAGFVMTGKSFYQWVWPPHVTFYHPTLCDIFVRNIASEFKRIVSYCVILCHIRSYCALLCLRFRNKQYFCSGFPPELSPETKKKAGASHNF